MVCKDCGQHLADDLQFCTRCGTPVERTEPPKASKNEKAPKKKGITGLVIALILCGVLLIGVIGGVIWWFFLREKPEEEEKKTKAPAPAALELDVSRHSIAQDDEDGTVFFYAVLENSSDKVELFNNKTNEVVATMRDDGEDCDQMAGDLIYTASVELPTDAEISTHFIAKSGKQKSDVEIVSIIAPLTDNELDDIELVDNAINDLLDGDFYETEYEERKENTLQTLNQLAEDSLIEADTIYVDDETGSVTFYYTSGVIGMVCLKQYTGSVPVAGPGSFGGYVGPYANNTSIGQTTTEPNQQETVDAKFLYAWFSATGVDRYDEDGFDLYTYYRDETRTLSTISSAYGANAVFDEDVTIEDLKNLEDDEFIYIAAHGCYTTFSYKNGERYFFFFEGKSRVTTSGFALLEQVTKDKNKTYSMDLKSGRIINFHSTIGKQYVITSAFFDEHYGRTAFKDSIISLGSCEIMGSNGNFCEDWAKVLTSKSVKAMTAFHNSVYISYGSSMCADMLEALFDGQTIDQAIAYAKEENGDDDVAWFHKHFSPPDTPHNLAAYINLRGDKDARLVSIIGSIRGKVADAVDKTPLEGVTIRITRTDADADVVQVTTDSSGNFIVDLEEGDYELLVSANAYMDCTITAIHVEKGHTTYLENTVLLTKVEDDPVSIVSGIVTNAVTNERVLGAVIRFRPNWGNHEGPFVEVDGSEVLLFTDENGLYYTNQLPYGYYTIEITCDLYATQYVNVIATDDEEASGNQNIVLAPEAHGSDFRITLEWEEDPRDEDAHIVGTGPVDFHVYFANRTAYLNGDLIANLDHDDINGNGFETVTLTVDSNAVYYYYVYHYAGYGSLSTSNAIVKVYQGNVMIKQFNVPVDQGTGRYWNVFNIVNGEVVPINRISDSSSQ